MKFRSEELFVCFEHIQRHNSRYKCMNVACIRHIASFIILFCFSDANTTLNSFPKARRNKVQKLNDATQMKVLFS